jgi:hypothetical protein
METTAGSLALVGSRSRDDGRARLRAAGGHPRQVELTEWANFAGSIRKRSRAGVHQRLERPGRFHPHPYDLGADPAGRAPVRVAGGANLCAVAIGPRPTARSSLRRLAQRGRRPQADRRPRVEDGIIPISHSQDTAGPIGRSVTDAAIVLGAIRSPFGEVVGSVSTRLPIRAPPDALRGHGSASTGDISRPHADDGLNRVADARSGTLVALVPRSSTRSAGDRSIEDDEITVL